MRIHSDEALKQALLLPGVHDISRKKSILKSFLATVFGIKRLIFAFQYYVLTGKSKFVMEGEKFQLILNDQGTELQARYKS